MSLTIIKGTLSVGGLSELLRFVAVKERWVIANEYLVTNTFALRTKEHLDCFFLWALFDHDQSDGMPAVARALVTWFW